MSAFVGVRYIKVMNQPLTASVCVLKYGNTFCTSVYPTTESTVPSFDFKHGCCIGSLGINEKLFIKSEPEISACCFQKRLPVYRIVCNCKAGSFIQLRNQVKFPCHLVCTSLSCFFFVLCRFCVFFCGWFYGMTVSLAKLGKFADVVEICADLQMVVVDISASSLHCFAVAELN